MLGINSNINSLVAQQNLNGTQNALSQAITRLSSGKRINSAADDAAGLAISTGMQTQINGLNQGVSNANDGVSMIQTATSGLSQITSSLQRIRTLAVQASSGGLTADNQASLQQEVQQQIAEVNRIASQTTYNGKSVLDGSAGTVNFQIGANVGQTISLDLSKSVSSANLGTGVVAKGSVLSTMTGLSLDAKTGNAATAGSTATLTSINVLADGKGGFSFTDQNNQALSSNAVASLFGGASATTGTGTSMTLTAQGALTSGATASQTAAIAAIQTANAKVTQGGFAAAGSPLATLAMTSTTPLKLDLSGEAAGADATKINSIQVNADGSGGYTYQALDGNGKDITSQVKMSDGTTGSAALATMFSTTAASGSTPGTIALSNSGSNALGATDAGTSATALSGAAAKNYIAPTYQTGYAAAGTKLGALNLDAGKYLDGTNLAAETAVNPGVGKAIQSIEVLADGKGGYTFQAYSGANGTGSSVDTSTSATSLSSLFTSAPNANGAPATLGLSGGALTADATASGGLSGINTAAANTSATKLGSVSVNLDASGNPLSSGSAVYSSVDVYADGNGGYTFAAVKADGTGESTNSAINGQAAKLFSVGSATSTGADALSGVGTLANNPNVTAAASAITSANTNNQPVKVSDINISTTAGANLAMESIDNALNAVNTIQSSLGAAQNRFTAISTTQQSMSTNLSQAQSQITDANFAQETANLSKAQVLQQAGISVLAQANSLPQQVLKLLG
ncbi:flagellin domain-containing protein [Caballeronia ptereochthonis]|uniref:Flagellin n=1 Tax=Caballeronia ptereochthonis TaxID=1777144 RepID=A0A158DAX4_9BURK|nr:flagellin domain-containing protein [Caballeronia ptereochthonis]